jgi:hypothetical protein
MESNEIWLATTGIARGNWIDPTQGSFLGDMSSVQRKGSDGKLMPVIPGTESDLVSTHLFP